jgi:hypothetical protein
VNDCDLSLGWIGTSRIFHRVSPKAASFKRSQQLSFGVFGLRLLVDGDVGVGILPDAEELLVSFATGGSVPGERPGACQADVG